MPDLPSRRLATPSLQVMGAARDERWSLAGQTALVTGGTRDVGRAIAEELARHGASVYISAQSEEDVRARVQAWNAEGLHGVMQGSACDFTSPKAREELMSRVSQHFSGKLNILVNNARIVLLSHAVNVPLSEFSELLNINLELPYHMSQLAQPLLKASGQGTIVFLSSIGGSIALSDQTASFGMTKGAINELTRSLAIEWAKDNVRVNAVAPGYFLPDMLNSLSSEEEYRMSQRVPLQRIAKPSEISSVVAFLCMPCASYITGSVIPVDGGCSIHNSS